MFFAENFYVRVDPAGYEIKLTDKYLLIADDFENYNIKVDIVYTEENRLTFITFNNPKKGFPWIPEGKNKLLVIYSHGCINLYSKEKIEPVFSSERGKEIYYGKYFNYKSTSFLTDKYDSYPAENLGNESLNKPYAEGKKDSGIGEKIIITPKEKMHIFSLMISNGYVSYNNSKLYTSNNRVKKVSLDTTDGFHIGTYELEDTPQIQEIKFYDVMDKVHDIIITIEDIYPGDKYNDTCINFIIPGAWYN